VRSLKISVLNLRQGYAHRGDHMVACH